MTPAKPTDAKHTPGPWHYEKSEHWPHEFVITGSNEHGGYVLPILGRTHNWPHNAEANARLIAAAPDLLSVADEAPILSKYHTAAGFESERFIADDEAWSTKKRAAISKATGAPTHGGENG